MKQYAQMADGSYSIGYSCIPNESSNADYVKMMEEVNLGTAEIVPYSAPVPTAEEIAEQGKRDGFVYNGVIVPVTNEDAIGAIQLKIAFEDFAMPSSVFHLSNGERLTLTLAEWPAFSAQFFSTRASFF